MSAEDILGTKISPFYERKMRTYFQCLDRKKTGILTREDHEALSKRWQELAELDTIREKQARRKIMTLWDLFFEEATHGLTMTPEIFGKCIAFQSHDQVVASAHHYADVLFDLIDLNSDGIITPDEFILLHKLFYHSEKTAMVAFKALEKDNAGHVTHMDFTKAVIDFFLPTGEEELPTDIIFGPLVK